MGIDQSFEDIKDTYVYLREKERKNLSDYLHVSLKKEQPEITVVSGSTSGKGIKEYTSNGRIHPFDLRNWKWIADCISK